MADPFVGEIRMLGINFAPQRWAACDGQLLPLAQNTALFSLLGTQFGGNGQSNFALPDMRGRAPIGQSQGPGLTPRTMGEQIGEAAVSLVETELPAHSHGLQVSTLAADRGNASNALLASSQDALYAVATPSQVLDVRSVTAQGGGQPHNNMQPYLVINFCIALQGVFPPRW